MKILKSLTFFTVIAVLASCGSPVKTVKAENVDLSNYESFAYLPNTDIEVEGKSYNTEAVNQTVVESINSQLKQEGYEMDKDAPDLLVLVSAKTDREVETTTDPVYANYPYTAGMNTVSPYYSSYYYNGYMNYSGVVGYDTDTYSYTEGTVIIDIIDRETKQTVWKGVTSEPITAQGTTTEIKDLIAEIFQEYPLS